MSFSLEIYARRRMIYPLTICMSRLFFVSACVFYFFCHTDWHCLVHFHLSGHPRSWLAQLHHTELPIALSWILAFRAGHLALPMLDSCFNHPPARTHTALRLLPVNACLICMVHSNLSSRSEEGNLES